MLVCAFGDVEEIGVDVECAWNDYLDIIINKNNRGGNIMANEYTDEENQMIFIQNMNEYRNLIKGETEKEIERITKNYAKTLVKQYKLKDRTANGIAERLVYFDNLLAGVEFLFKYYLDSSFEKYFGLLPRVGDDKTPNKWKTQHEARREKDSPK